MKFASLGSGSDGNAMLISTGSGSSKTVVMLDCGFGIRETERRLARLAMQPTDITGIVVTHEHQDHVGGVFKFARRHKIPVWLSFGTFQAIRESVKDINLNFCRDGDRFAIGALELNPYTVPHDAREPVQYVATDGHAKLGVLTDAGHATAHMIAALSSCDALLLECNHDRQMLANSTYPASLKLRIGGAYGHLSNDSSAEIVGALDRSRLKTIVAAHLSKQNNTPDLVRTALLEALGTDAVQLRIACQETGFEWLPVI